MSMQGMTAPHAAALLHPPKRSALAHIPGEEGWPIIGRTLAVLADPKGEVERMATTYGPVYRILGEKPVRWVQQTDFQNEEAVGYLADRL